MLSAAAFGTLVGWQIHRLRHGASTIETVVGSGYRLATPRKLPVQYAGVKHHVLNRGDQREPIFKDEKDRHRFLTTLGEACQNTAWQGHAYCLMSNHFHLVIATFFTPALALIRAEITLCL